MILITRISLAHSVKINKQMAVQLLQIHIYMYTLSRTIPNGQFLRQST